MGEAAAIAWPACGAADVAVIGGSFYSFGRAVSFGASQAPAARVPGLALSDTPLATSTVVDRSVPAAESGEYLRTLLACSQAVRTPTRSSMPSRSRFARDARRPMRSGSAADRARTVSRPFRRGRGPAAAAGSAVTTMARVAQLPVARSSQNFLDTGYWLLATGLNEDKSTRYHRLRRRADLLGTAVAGVVAVGAVCCLGGAHRLRELAAAIAQWVPGGLEEGMTVGRVDDPAGR